MIKVFKHSQLLKAIEIANEKKSKLHLIGLVSRGGVHSFNRSFVGIVQAFEKEKATVPVFIHGFTDGRDCSPNSGLFAFQELSKQINGSSIQIASIVGRYYAMDRDQRWERIKKGLRSSS